MAQGLAEFQKVVMQDTALQEQFKSVSDPASFTDLAVRLGKERGFSFTSEDVQTALADLQTSRRVLSDELLDKVAGGDGEYCGTTAGGTNVCTS